ncbi:hypothetical protein ONZ45_g5027 [Pleurotus djamor]|nr:hypothetical protein ONZ45_g5027 [Pleurotus djamor]
MIHREPGRHAHGIIYLHRLTDPRATTVPKDYAPIFKRLCGEDWTKKFIVATTLYNGNDLENKQATVKSSFWKDGVLEGALLDRFTETEADAWRIVNLALGK